MNPRLALVAIFLAATAAAMAAVLLDFVNTGFFVGPYRFSHWLTWIGTLFVAVYAPLYHLLKRRYPRRYTLLLDIHSFGFLAAFFLISVHFAAQLGRVMPPELGEGIALYTVMVLLVSTGIVQRFWSPERRPVRRYTPRTNRFLHTGLITAFYVVIAVHALINFD